MMQWDIMIAQSFHHLSSFESSPAFILFPERDDKCSSDIFRHFSTLAAWQKSNRANRQCFRLPERETKNEQCWLTLTLLSFSYQSRPANKQLECN